MSYSREEADFPGGLSFVPGGNASESFTAQGSFVKGNERKRKRKLTGGNRSIRLTSSGARVEQSAEGY